PLACLVQHSATTSIDTLSLHDALPIWVSSRNELVNYRHEPGNATSLSDNFIRAVCQDDLGGFWIGTFRGLDYLNPETKEFKSFRSEEHTSELQSRENLVCRLLLEKKKT